MATVGDAYIQTGLMCVILKISQKGARWQTWNMRMKSNRLVTIIGLISISLLSCDIRIIAYPPNAPHFLSPQSIGEWVYQEVKYKSDSIEFWQYPHETIEKMAGDCEDMALLTMYLTYINFGIKPDMEIVYYEDINDYHAIPTIHGVELEPSPRSGWILYQLYAYDVAMDQIMYRRGTY
jgi:hypothetical protein